MLFDLQEVLDYYEDFFDIRYLERKISEQIVDEREEFKMFSNMKIYNKKMLLDQLVDNCN